MQTEPLDSQPQTKRIFLSIENKEYIFTRPQRISYDWVYELNKYFTYSFCFLSSLWKEIKHRRTNHIKKLIILSLVEHDVCCRSHWQMVSFYNGLLNSSQRQFVMIEQTRPDMLEMKFLHSLTHGTSSTVSSCLL